MNHQSIGLGTYQLGGETRRVCSRAIALGYRHFDTASLYRNESAVRKAILESGIPSDEFFVTTKIWRRDIECREVEKAVLSSLNHLERIDLVLLHGPAKFFADAWDRLQTLSQKHEIPYIGVSNFGIGELEQLNGQVPTVNQIEVSPFLQRTALVEYCERENISVIAHSPLTKANRLSEPLLRECANRTGGTPAQILLAWSLKRGFFPIPRSRCSQHLAENLAATKIELRQADMEQLCQLEDNFATHRKLVN